MKYTDAEPSKDEEKAQVFTANLFRTVSNPDSFNAKDSEFEVQVVTNGTLIKVVPDTGARISVLGSQQAKTLNLMEKMGPTTVKIKPYNSDPIPALGVARCAVSFGSTSVPVDW